MILTPKNSLQYFLKYFKALPVIRLLPATTTTTNIKTVSQPDSQTIFILRLIVEDLGGGGQRSIYESEINEFCYFFTFGKDLRLKRCRQKFQKCWPK